jgi:hypothetical protein
MIEGSGSGSIPLTSGSGSGSGSIPLTSGSGSGRPKTCGSGGSGSATLHFTDRDPDPVPLIFVADPSSFLVTSNVNFSQMFLKDHQNRHSYPKTVLGIHIRILLGLPDPDPLVSGIDPALDPSLFS